MSVPQAVTLLQASQPDIVRSAEKDELYLHQLVEACHEAVRRLVGPFRALQYARESKLLATLLYHGLTTGLGQQTLGEEYCNMMQVNGSGRLPPLPRRVVLVLLQALGPYCGDTLAARLDRSADMDALHLMGGDDSDDGDGDGPALRRSSSSSGGGGGGGADDDDGSADVAGAAADGNGGGPSRRHGGDWLSRLLAGAHRAAERGAAAGRRVLLEAWPTIRPGLVSSGRLHLALFYCYGIYYHLSHRLAGVRYISTTRPLQTRTSYRALGLMLMLQLGVTAAIQAAHSAAELHRKRRRRAAGGDGADGDDLPTSAHATVLPDVEEDEEEEDRGAGGARDADQAAPTTSSSSLLAGQQRGQQQGTGRGAGGDGGGGGTGGGGDGGGVGGGRTVVTALPSRSTQQCPLCLSVRTHPTSTPCGHVFCWVCVAQWCGEKAECPLCRSRVTVTQLVGVYHSAF